MFTNTHNNKAYFFFDRANCVNVTSCQYVGYFLQQLLAIGKINKKYLYKTAFASASK